ncbi:N-(5'-phosphoribosyl)anthranilate isomerase [Youhaiella tibetensis]|uniref:N-(5'-phosphoribosyl)anthranilate isomerase n=1 Tax=Paradevosia tibetensis TaxID=1447062 RepID=A0A5B9DIC8_9HYPH|nr:phosphoribosylanthranilate isomerase [Youhaiella tibetensis]AKR57929.1 N-(5'-phosphoribosyl)anthranilate isomerase [Devosia sp. H5989]QEE18806.1 phosphoribosylanthranilate isomerase [Youhaiella tibetensis]GGF38980.1 N-(5'-phosphoribosyl)anthranilate isomerase [Youhaiella tibetensis]
MSTQPIIKICGIKTPAILEAAIDAGADMVGFAHFPRSPRHVGVEAIGDLISQARGRVETCVLLVNPDNSVVAEIAALGPDWLQLHGPETPHRVEAIRAEAGIPVMKALPVGSAADLAQVPAFLDVADRILLDAKPPKGADRPGGLGVPFDWSLLKALDPAIAFMLSGGLTPDTVAEAIQRVKPFGIDVSSGVETAPGEKDERLIAAFIRNARMAAAA